MKKLVFAGLLLLGLLLVSEVASGLGFLFLDGTYFSWSRLQQEREGVLGGSASSPIRDHLESPRSEAPPAPPQTAAREALHPFLGFVLDPASNRKQRRRERGENEITELGFYRPPGPPPARRGDELRIGVFGGSVAFIFALAGQNRLIEELTRRLGGQRDIVVDCFALGGYKQPQQLMTLAYLLTLGERFDVVINLDGFNEVGLPMMENLPAGVHPSYPGGWRHRVAGLPDLEAQALAWAILETRRRRQQRAARYSSPLLRFSVTANLLWRAGDIALQRKMVELEQQLNRQQSEEERRGFEAHGPPYSSGDLSDDAHRRTADGDATYRDLVHLWRASSLQMHQLCEANGILYLHLLQPNQYVPGSKPMGSSERRQAFQEDHPLRMPVVEGYPLLVEAGEELSRQGVRFHDLRFLFRNHSEPLYFDTCCHFNQRGCEILADTVAEIIANNLDVFPADSFAD